MECCAIFLTGTGRRLPTDTDILRPLSGSMHPSSHLDINNVDRMVQVLLQHGLAPSTQRTYYLAQSRYFNFCIVYNLSPIPLTQMNLCHFAASLVCERVANKSIKGYLSALRYAHTTQMGSDPNISGMVILHLLLQGIKRRQAVDQSTRVHPHLLITGTVTRLLKQAWELQGPHLKGTML